MNEPIELRGVGTAGIVDQICTGRSCRACPLYRFPENCFRLPREIVIDAYRKVFEVSEFEVTEEELMNIINCE